MAGYINEPARRLSVRGSYDIVVVGGGVAGVAAALAAARGGASVCLLEKESALGGLATLGNVVLYMHLCDGRGRKVVGGIGEELMKLSAADGFCDVPKAWKRGGSAAGRAKTRLHTIFNPASYMLALEKLILAAGVKLYYDMRFCDVSMDRRSGRIKAVIVESKSGRQAIRCKSAIDASGDADVCHAAGERTVSLATNAPSAWCYAYNGRTLELQKVQGTIDRYARPVKGQKGYRGDDVESLTQQVIDSRDMIRKRIARLKRESGHDVFPVAISLLPDHRMTRRPRGSYELDRAADRKRFDDCIGLIGDWREPGLIWSIPYRSLVAPKIPNLIVAGRCISVAGNVWDATRVIPACAVTGQAAGAAAAIVAREHGGRFGTLAIPHLQAALHDGRVLLDTDLDAFESD